MFYEVKIKRQETAQDGKVKDVKETFLVENAEYFSEAENKLIGIYNGSCDVFAIKRSNIMDVYHRKSDDEHYYKAKITSIFVNDDGSEKEQHYYILIPAKDMDSANTKMSEYMEQGLSEMRLDSITKTNIVDIL